MKNLSLHFNSRQSSDWPLTDGMHRLVRGPDGALALGDASGDLLAQFRMDVRGLWLRVIDDAAGIHVNGRPVRRVALLRAGDAVHAGGMEILVRGQPGAAAAVPVQAADGADPADPCIVLRGIGGAHHGRSHTLSRPRRIGSGADADIRLATAGIPAQLAELRPVGQHVQLLAAANRQVLVNGVAMRETWLSAGDQIAFDPQARFVVEVPWQRGAATAGESESPRTAASGPMSASGRSATRWPWLLLAALLLAAALAALLLFGAN